MGSLGLWVQMGHTLVLTWHWVIFCTICSFYLHFQWVGVYSHTIVSNLPQDDIEYSFLRCRVSVHQGSCWTTLDTEESLFGSIRRPSWDVLVVSFHILYFIFIDLQVFFNGKLVVHPHRIPTFWQHLPIIRVQYLILLGFRFNNVVSLVGMSL
jgi:hypothetical protein